MGNQFGNSPAMPYPQPGMLRSVNISHQPNINPYITPPGFSPIQQTGGFTGPSYAAGINNAGYSNTYNRDCCDCSGNYMNNPSVPPMGYPGAGLTTIPQMQGMPVGCCDDNTVVYQNTPMYPIVTGAPNLVQVQRRSQVVTTTPMNFNGVVAQPPLITQNFVQTPSMTQVETEVAPIIASNVVSVNPFASLPTRIVTVIQKLGSANPLRGSIVNRLDAPQYVPEKQAYYQGQWVNGYMQGFGRLMFDNGAYFEGQFDNGSAFTRNGLFIYPDGSYYIGGVDRNTANGQGQFNYRGGRLIYRGQFLNDQPDGQGVQLYSDGSRYQGEFRFGKKQGRGQFTWKDGTVYTGQFENGFMQGEGIHRLSNGEVYEGEFRKNKRHGRGRHTATLGVYIGGYKRDTKEGEGQFIWADGKVFKGNFKDGRPDGPGSISLVDGSTVFGIWINGVLDQNSLTTVNPFRGSQIQASNLKGSIASVGSIGSLPNVPYTGIIRTSQVMGGPPIINLHGGTLAGGFSGKASPFVGPRGSILSVIGPGGQFRGSSIPRGSNINMARGSSLSIINPSSIITTTTGIPGQPAVYPVAFNSNIINIPPLPRRGSTIGAPIITPIINPTIITSPSMIPSVGLPPGTQVNQVTTTTTTAVNPGFATQSPFASRGVSPIPRGSMVSQMQMRPVSSFSTLPATRGPLLMTPQGMPQQYNQTLIR